jgi:hypothetical protein
METLLAVSLKAGLQRVQHGSSRLRFVPQWFATGWVVAVSGSLQQFQQYTTDSRPAAPFAAWPRLYRNG